MNRRNQFALPLARPAGVRALLIGVLACAASVSVLQSQTSAPPAKPTEAVPAAPARGAIPRTDAFGQNQGVILHPPSAGFGLGIENADQWSRSILDPFHPRPSFGDFSGSPGSAMPFNSVGSFNQFSQSSMSGHQNGIAPLFPSAGANSPFAAPPLAVPSLSQLMRTRLNFPLTSTPGSFSLFSPYMLKPAPAFGDLTRPYGSMIFSTSDLGNGMFLSAGTGFGHSTAGTPAASLGSNTSAEPKHSGPSVALRLSF
jgi:hypothetical protein